MQVLRKKRGPLRLWRCCWYDLTGLKETLRFCKIQVHQFFVVFYNACATDNISAVPQEKTSDQSSPYCCAEVEGRCWKGWRGGHLLGNRAWAWDVRTSLWDSTFGWIAWLGANVGRATCGTPDWLIEAIDPTTALAKVWPKGTGAAPSTCCPDTPEAHTVEAAVLLQTGEVVWALWEAVPNTVKYKAIGHGTTC